MTYKEAFCAIYDRRHAFSKVQPFSARIVGQGSSFLYRQGVLCVQTGSTVHVTDLRSTRPTFQVDLVHLFKSTNICDDGYSFEMMYYNDNILSVLAQRGSKYATPGLIFCVRTASDLQDTERVLGHVVLEDGWSKLFVRHTARSLVYGTHTGTGGDGHRKWEIKGRSLLAGEAEDQEPADKIILEGFHGNDIGSTVAFEIHDGFFYAVSNQGTYEVEEVDWTSFYHCVRFPLDNPVAEAVQQDTRVYRRQHAEGAIHDSWTDLTLQHNEKTNDIFIVESRREWVGATSKQARTFYTSRISFSAPASTDYPWDLHSSRNDIAPPLPLPENDILTTVLRSSHNANFMPTPRQYSWTRHPEFLSTMLMKRNSQSFILARTKFRAYNLSCSTFVDFVEDERCCPDRPATSLPCLRLRIGSRRVAPSDFILSSYECGNATVKNDFTPDGPHCERVRFADKTQYRYAPIRMWPPPPTTCPCAARQHRILNPVFRPTSGMSSGQKGITAICDERSVVYMIKPSRSYNYGCMNHNGTDIALGTIVLVDFGRPSVSNSSSVPTDSDLCWDWAPGQEKRCRSGTCR